MLNDHFIFFPFNTISFHPTIVGEDAEFDAGKVIQSQQVVNICNACVDLLFNS